MAIPQSQAEHEELIAVANGSQAIFAPAVCFASSGVMGKKIPRSPVRAVVFPNRSPRTFADIRPPAAPEELSLSFEEAPAFFRRCGWRLRP